MDQAAQARLSRGTCTRRRPASVTLLAVACVLAVASLAQEPPKTEPSGTGPAPTPAVELRALLDKTTDPVLRLVLAEEISLADAKSALAALRLKQARAATDAAEEANRLIQLQLDVIRRTEAVKSVAECSELLRRIIAHKRDLADIEESILRAQAALAEQKRTCELLTEAVRHIEKAATDGSLEAVAPLATWDGHLRQRFTEAVAESVQTLELQRQTLESLESVQQGRLRDVQKTLSVLSDKQALVSAAKDRLFWQRQPVPYSLETVKDAWLDVKKLSSGAYDFVLSLPGALPRMLVKLIKPPVLWEFLGSCAILAGGLFLILVIARRIGARLKGSMSRLEEAPATWKSRLALLGLRCVYSEVRYWLGLSIAAGLWLMFVALQDAYTQVVATEAVPAGGVTQGLSLWRAALVFWFAYLVIGGYRLARRLIFESIVEREGHAPLFPLPGEVARHVTGGLKLITTAGAAVLLLIAVLSALGYRPEVVSLLWTVLRGIIFISILWPIARRGVFERMLSGRKTLVARLVCRAISFLYVPAVIAVFALLLFSSVGYVALSHSIIAAALEVALGMLIIGLVARSVAVRLRMHEQKVRTQLAERPGLLLAARALELTRAVVQAVGVLAVLCFVASLLWFHYGTVVFSPRAPAFVRVTAGKVVAAVTASAASALRPMYAGSRLTPVRLVAAFLVVVAILAAASPLRRMFERYVLARTSLDADGRYTMSAVITYGLVAVGGIFALHVSGIPLAGLGIFAGAIGLAVGFGMQAVLSNFVSGIIMMIERHVKIGDCVKIGDDLIGHVERINARSTTIATFDNHRVIIPNSEFIENQVINWSTGDPKLRTKVNVGVMYGSNTDLAAKSLIKAAHENALVLKHPAPEVRFLEFGDNALQLQLLVWVADVRDYYKAISDLHFQIDREFRANGIEIAFPQRDLHLRSISPKAAEALRAQERTPPQAGMSEPQ